MYFFLCALTYRSWSSSEKTLDKVKKCIVDIFSFFIKTELSIFENGKNNSLTCAVVAVVYLIHCQIN